MNVSLFFIQINIHFYTFFQMDRYDHGNYQR